MSGYAVENFRVKVWEPFPGLLVRASDWDRPDGANGHLLEAWMLPDDGTYRYYAYRLDEEPPRMIGRIRPDPDDDAGPPPLPALHTP